MRVNSLGEPLPDPIKVLWPCEVDGCEESTHQYYTTCETHTNLILKIDPDLIRFNKYPSYIYNSPVESSTMFDFRLSASYVSRYHNCHASANLTEALPGFVHPERNNNGMKGTGSLLHGVFEVIVKTCEDLEAAATCLRWVASYWGPKRRDLLQDEKAYITEWFLKYKTAPPIDVNVLQPFILTKEGRDGAAIVTTVEPRRIEFLADALDEVARITSTLENPKIFVEEKKSADWLETAPYTTADLIITDGDHMYVIDLKMGDIEVSPIENEQLMYYAKTFITTETEVTLVILQRKNISDWDVSVEALNGWADKIRESERQIQEGDLTFTVGSHCTFCPANPVGRGDKGNVFCPKMLQVQFGARDEQISDESVLADDYV